MAFIVRFGYFSADGYRKPPSVRFGAPLEEGTYIYSPIEVINRGFLIKSFFCFPDEGRYAWPVYAQPYENEMQSYYYCYKVLCNTIIDGFILRAHELDNSLLSNFIAHPITILG